MDEINTRIKLLREAQGWSRRQLANEMREKEDKIVAIEHGRQRITVGDLVKISKVFDVSFNWLIEGSDEPASPQVGHSYTQSIKAGDAYANNTVVGNTIREQQQDYQLESYAYVPRYEIQASAGSGSHVDVEYADDYLAFRRSWLASKSLKPDKLAVIQVIGDSMQPQLLPKDKLLIDTGNQSPRDGGIFAIRIDDDLIVKRLLRDEDGWQINSDNPAYKPMRLSERTSLVGMVVLLMRDI